MIISFKTIEGENIGIPRDGIYRITEAIIPIGNKPRCVIEYNCGSSYPGKIHVLGEFNEIVNYINIGKWQKIK